MPHITAFAIVALGLVIGLTISAEPGRKEAPKAIDVNPKPLSSDPSVKVDYDFVYVRAPRFIKSADGKEHPSAWPEIGHPTVIGALDRPWLSNRLRFRSESAGEGRSRLDGR